MYSPFYCWLPGPAAVIVILAGPSECGNDIAFFLVAFEGQGGFSLSAVVFGADVMVMPVLSSDTVIVSQLSAPSDNWGVQVTLEVTDTVSVPPSTSKPIFSGLRLIPGLGQAGYDNSSAQ